LVDWLNQFVPVAGVVDSVDRVVPSFILFIAFLILLFIGIFALFFMSGGGTGISFEAEVTVLSMQSAPVVGAVVSFSQECSDKGDVSLSTNASGKVIFKACSDSADLRVSKEGFITKTESISFEDNKGRIYLSQIPTSSQRIINIKVKDSSRNTLDEVEVYLACVKGTKVDENLVKSGVQPASGFLVTLPSGCDSIQVKATAQGYSEKKELIGSTEENKTIILDKVDLSGTAVFEVDSNSGKKEAMILVTDELGREFNVVVDSTGIATKNYASGEYSYSATLLGVQKRGTFTVTTNQTTTVEIFFDEVTTAYVAPIKNGTSLGAYLKLLDGNTGVGGAEVRLFYKKNGDTNYFTKLNSSYVGVVGHYPLTDTNNRMYYAIIKSINYATKLIAVEYKTSSDAPQEVVMTKGGANLKVIVVDDTNKLVSNAVVSITKSDFGGKFEEPKTTDKNGAVEFKSLPNGTYKIEGESLINKGSIESISISSDTTVILKIITGVGNVKFSLLNKGEPVNALCELYEKVSADDLDLLSSANSVNGYYTALNLKAEKKVYLAVPDKNFIYVESPIVSVKRGNQNRDVILYKQSDLPNSNKVQMFLEGVYESNPWIDSESMANSLMPGKKYYFLFTLIANNDSSRYTVANVFVSPKDKNIIDANTKMFIEDAFSTRASIVQTSLIMNSSRIALNPASTSNPARAKQLNIDFGDTQGLVAFPIVVEVSVDSNAKGSTSLFWEGIAGTEKSILYSKEFVVGEKFCFGSGKCPELLFSNFIRRVDPINPANNSAWTPVEDYEVLQLGDFYDLNVTVQNLTDVDIGESELVGKIKSSSVSKLLFSDDLNSVSFNVNVSEFDKNSAVFELNPILASPSASVIESLVKGTQLKEYNGNNFDLKFNIRKKEDINFQIIATSTPNVIYSKSAYPLFYLKTFYKSNKLPAKTNWEITVKGANLPSLKYGETDENGEWLGELDLSSYAAGTVLVFTATDVNNSNPGYFEITLQDAFVDPVTETVADCISVKIGVNDIKTIDIPVVYSQVGSTGGSFTIDSNCSEDRGIIIYSDLGVTPGNRFTIKAGESQTVTLSDPDSVVVERSGMLGAYPLQIMQVINKTKFNQIGYLDVVVSDSESVFSLNDAIIDLRKSGSFSSKVTNNQYSGRLDIYYPQMDISTNSVGLSYTKPGIPEKIDFNAVVETHAIEAMTYAYHYGSKVGQGTMQTKCSSTTVALFTPKELIFTDLAQEQAEAAVNTVTDAIASAEEVETPDSNDRDPSKSFYDLPVPIQNKIISELHSTSGTLNSGKTASTAPVRITVNKLYLADSEESDSDDEINGNPMNPATGDIYEIYPEMAGDFNNSTCDDINSDCSGSDSEEGSYKKVCDGCQVSYNRVKINPIAPDNFDGATCGGQVLMDENDSSDTEDYDGYTDDDIVQIADDGSDIESDSDSEDSSDSDVEVDSSVWTKVEQSIVGRLKVLYVAGCNPCKVLYFGDWLGGMYTRGVDDKDGFWENFGHMIADWFGRGSSGSAGQIVVQDEYIHSVTLFNERKSTWSKVLEFTPKEGTVVRLEPKYDYSVEPQWSNIDSIIDENIIDEYADKNVLLTEVLVMPHGIVPFSVTQGGCGGGYSAPDVNDTLVEYRNAGLVYSQIPADTVPDGLRVFLKDGYIYAEYIGDNNTQEGNEIDFTVSKVNLQGSEYAILTVRDWVNGEKVEKIFQVKILGNPNNCYSLEGLPGLTGKQFSPRLSFNWDWNSISYNQCDSTNPSYTYCDATQFTISMFKRLEKINSALIANDNKALPQYASFYAYLIRDNYSTNFLEDFDNYYSTKAFSSSSFNSTSDFTGYDSFITGGKIDYYYRNGSDLIHTGSLPSGGLYRVEIETALVNPSVESLFNQREANANIKVTFTLIKQASNYNLFYETPFDGEVSKTLANKTKSRAGYGVSLDQGEIFIGDKYNADSLKSKNYSGTPLVTIDYTSSTDLDVLNDQMVLVYKDLGTSGKSLEFNPMQPTPVVLKIDGTNLAASGTKRTITAPYKMGGFGASTVVGRDWTLLSSTLGKSGKCTDLSGNQTYSFTEKTNGTEKYFEWVDTSKSGTIELATTFFTPAKFNTDGEQSVDTTSASISSEYANKLKLLTVEGSTLKQGTSVQLDYFSDIEYEKYQSLKGMFEMIAEGKLCVSQSAATEMRVWWNQDYLNSLRETVAYNKSNSCLD
jgi:hypothetical protein